MNVWLLSPLESCGISFQSKLIHSVILYLKEVAQYRSTGVPVDEAEIPCARIFYMQPDTFCESDGGGPK